MSSAKQWKRSLASGAILAGIVILSAGCGANGNTDHVGHEAGEIVASEPAAAQGHDEHEHDEHSNHESAEESSDAAISFSYPSGKPQAGETTRMELSITGQDGKPIESFDISHEKKLHLIAVSSDLSYFNHIHPEYEGGGKFTAAVAFPSGGAYKLYADFVPTGQGSTTLSTQVEVNGPAADEVVLAPDNKLVQSMSGNQVTLALSSTKAGEEADLTFQFTEEASGNPIQDLEPYLGAVGHVVIVSADLEQYLHVHPMDEKGSGPNATFMTTFPEAGVYKIWGQFQRGGTSFIVPFVVGID